jgi:hypothetical protein
MSKDIGGERDVALPAVGDPPHNALGETTSCCNARLPLLQS